MIEIIKISLLLLVLLFASIQDLKERRVDDKYSVALIAIGFIGVTWDNAIALILIFTSFMIIAMLTNLGGADVKIASALAFVLGSEIVLIALIIGLTLSVIIEFIISIFRKENILKRKYPLVPYIGLGCVVTIIMNGVT